MIQIDITEKVLETYGSLTLYGLIARTNLPLSSITAVELVFHETSAEWRRRNDGPKLFVMPEYVPSLFLADVLSLIAQGIQLKVSRDVLEEES